MVFLEVETAPECDIDGEAAFVEFIEDDCGYAIEIWVFLEDALEDTIGEVKDFCVFGVTGIEADGVADFAAEGCFAVVRNEASEETCGHAAGLDDNYAVTDFRKVSDNAGDFGRFSGAGWGREKDALVVRGGGAKFGGDFVDWQLHAARLVERRGGCNGGYDGEYMVEF